MNVLEAPTPAVAAEPKSARLMDCTLQLRHETRDDDRQRQHTNGNWPWQPR